MKNLEKANSTAILDLQQLKNVQILDVKQQKNVKGGNDEESDAIIVEELVDH